MALMSHKISIFQLISIVKNLICAAKRGVAFLSSARRRKFCQNRAKNLDISPFFSTHARKLKTTNPPRSLTAFVWRTRKPTTRSHTKTSPRARDVYQLFPLHSRAAKSPSVGKRLTQSSLELRPTSRSPAHAS